MNDQAFNLNNQIIYMLEKGKLKLWQWVILFLMGFLFPMYNIFINNSFLALSIQITYYVFLVMFTTVIFSTIMFLIFNHFRRKAGYEKRMDTAFILYVLSTSFGSFASNITTEIGIFTLPFLIAYFLEIKKVLSEFPRE